MGRTCGEPDGIELTAIGVKLNGSRHVPDAAVAPWIEVPVGEDDLVARAAPPLCATLQRRRTVARVVRVHPELLRGKHIVVYKESKSTFS